MEGHGIPTERRRARLRMSGHRPRQDVQIAPPYDRPRRHRTEPCESVPPDVPLPVTSNTMIQKRKGPAPDVGAPDGTWYNMRPGHITARMPDAEA